MKKRLALAVLGLAAVVLVVGQDSAKAGNCYGGGYGGYGSYYGGGFAPVYPVAVPSYRYSVPRNNYYRGFNRYPYGYGRGFSGYRGFGYRKGVTIRTPGFFLGIGR